MTTVVAVAAVSAALIAIHSLIKSLNFGIEIETVGKTREEVANAIQSIVGGSVIHVGTPVCYDPWHVIAADGRTWKVVRDSSLDTVPAELQAEVVSPILAYGDIDTLQEIVRAIRKIGSRSTPTDKCGIHIHIDAARFTVKAVKNLLTMAKGWEPWIFQAIQIADCRKGYCKTVNDEMYDRISRIASTHSAVGCKESRTLNRAWYGYENTVPGHYDQSRYHGVNLHNIWFRGTVEFRYFNGTLHAGKVKSYVQFCLAMSAKAILSNGAKKITKTFNDESSKCDFRSLLVSIGLVGDEFKTARTHLLANLKGSSAFRSAAAAQAHAARWAERRAGAHDAE